MVVSKNLRKIREKTMHSQQRIADVLGIDKNTYANWESGKNDIKSQYIPLIAKEFGVDIKDLFQTKSSEINIFQNNTDNKDNSVNYSVVLVLPDKESVDRIVETFKSK